MKTISLNPIPLIGCGLAALLAGCLDEPDVQDDDIVESLRAAIPSAQDLMIQLPEAPTDASGAVAAVGDPAILLAQTANIAYNANGSISASYDYVESLTYGPPTSYTATRAEWGPWDYPAYPLVYRFWAEQVSPDLVEFAMEARPKNSANDPFVAVITGSTERDPATGRYFGSIVFDYDAHTAMDPSSPYAGVSWIGFDHRNDPSVISAHNTDDSDPNSPLDVTYEYRYRADGSGSLEYSASGGVDPNGNPYGGGALATQWDATGAGRADASQSDATGTQNWNGTECWNAAFGRVYYSDDAPQNPDEGAATDCIFSNPL
jgi:hypothetical protein